MQCSEWLQSYQIVHDTGRIAVVWAKVEPAKHRVLHLLITETNVFLDVGILDADWLGEVSEDVRVGKV